MNSHRAGWPRYAVVASVVFLVAVVAACAKKDRGDSGSGGSSGGGGVTTPAPTPTPTPTPTENRVITDFFSGATAVGETQVSATVVGDGTPPADGGGPAATAAGSAQAAPGGLQLISIEGSAPFGTIYLSIGSAQSARAPDSGPVPAWVFDLIAPPLSAAVIITRGYLVFNLPQPVTRASVVLKLANSLPQTFEVRIQIAASNGPSGPAVSMARTPMATSLIELVGVVMGRMTINPSNPTGPGLMGPPISGAVVSTSLDSRTTLTDANGAFDLVTNTPNQIGRCFRLTITAAGYPTYSSEGWTGSNTGGGGLTFTLIPPQPPDLGRCN